MTIASITRDGLTIVGSYSGGAYIELHWDSADSDAFEVINVWDYETGQSQINGTVRSVTDALAQWVIDIEDGNPGHDELRNYYRHTA